MKLRQLQIHLQQLLQNSVADSVADSILNKGSRLASGAGLAIYQSTQRASLQRALGDIFPVCHQLVGDDFFAAMVEKYLVENPSTSFSLDHYGFELPQFIQGFSPAMALPYLADVARLELASHQAFYAKDQAGFNIDVLSNATHDKLGDIVFVLRAGSTLLCSEFPIHQIWVYHQGNYGDDKLNLVKGTFKLFIWRNNFDVKIEVLNDDEWIFLTTISLQQKFATICQEIVKKNSRLDIVRLLQKAVQIGWIEKCMVPETN